MHIPTLDVYLVNVTNSFTMQLRIYLYIWGSYVHYG